MKNDTSYYSECNTRMRVYEKRHIQRLFVMIGLLLANFYFYVPTFAITYMGNSFASAMILNGEIDESYAQGVDMGTGIGGLFAMALAMVAGIILFSKCKNNKIRIGYVAGVAVVFAAITIMQQHKVASAPGAGERVGVSHLAYGMGILTLVLSVTILILGLFGNHTHPKLYAAMLVLILLGGLAKCYFWPFAVIIGVLYVIAIPEYVKMQEMIKLPGYPYFNERFEEQQAHSEFETNHKLDGRSFAVMEDLEGAVIDTASAEAEHEKRKLERREPAAIYTMREGSKPDEMPGIDDIFEAPAIPFDDEPAGGYVPESAVPFLRKQ